LDNLNKTLAQVSQPFQATFVSTAETFNKKGKAYLPNPLDIHPNHDGYLVLANAIWNEMFIKDGVLFSDDLPEWAKEEVQYLVKKGIIQGYVDGSFGGNDAISRVHSALMLKRAII